MDELRPGTRVHLGDLRVPGVLGRREATVVRKVADGPHGAWYLAEVSGTRVLLTVLDPAFSRAPEAAGALEADLARASSVQHKNLLPLLGRTSYGPTDCLVWADPNGTSLRRHLSKRLSEGGTFDFPRVQAIAAHVARALSALHPATPHGFICLDTIFVARTGRVYLGEGGVGPLLHLAPGFARFRIAGLVPCAPERRDDPARVTQRGDIYCLAACCYELLTGRTVGAGGEVDERALAGTAPIHAVEVLRAALDPDPTRRPASAAAFRRALRSPRADRGTAVPAAETSPMRAAPVPAGRSPDLVGSGPRMPTPPAVGPTPVTAGPPAAAGSTSPTLQPFGPSRAGSGGGPPSADPPVPTPGPPVGVAPPAPPAWAPAGPPPPAPPPAAPPGPSAVSPGSPGGPPSPPATGAFRPSSPGPPPPPTAGPSPGTAGVPDDLAAALDPDSGILSLTALDGTDEEPASAVSTLPPPPAPATGADQIREAPAPAGAERFVVIRKGVEYGPYDLDKLASLIVEGQLGGPDTLRPLVSGGKPCLVADIPKLREVCERVLRRNEARTPRTAPALPSSDHPRGHPNVLKPVLLVLLLFGVTAAVLWFVRFSP